MEGDTLLGKSIDDRIASSFFRARFFLCEFIELTSAIESIQGNNTVQCVHTPACTACTANLAKYLGRGTYYRGFSLQMVIWVTQIAGTLSIFNFSTWFLAQIVENREMCLSRPFLVPGDNFSKSYDETQIRYERPLVCTPWSGGGISLRRISPAVSYGRSIFVITFRKIILRP